MLRSLREFEAIKKYHEISHHEKYAAELWIIDYERLSFNDKATYLQWRSVWRHAYGTLSEHIRTLKPLRKSKRDTYSPSAQSDVAACRVLARAMLAQRKLSKAKAAKQYVPLGVPVQIEIKEREKVLAI